MKNPFKDKILCSIYGLLVAAFVIDSTPLDEKYFEHKNPHIPERSTTTSSSTTMISIQNVSDSSSSTTTQPPQMYLPNQELL